MSGTSISKDIEERLSNCMVDKDELAAVHLFISGSLRTVSDDNILTEADLGHEELKELNTTLNQLEVNKLECKKSHEQALKKYEEDSRNVFVAIFREIDELENIHKRTMLDQYLCETPLTALKDKFDSFLESFIFPLRNHFQEAAKANVGERCRNVMAELTLLEESSSKTLYENCILECMLKGQEAALSHILAMTDAIGNDVTSSLKTNIQNEVGALRNTKSVEYIIQGFKSDLVSLSQMSANVKVLKHILTMCNSKYNRLNYWLLQTKRWTNYTKSEEMLITDVLHLLHNEEEEATKVLCFLKDLETCLKNEHDNAVCRTISMESQLQNPIENSMLHTVLINILGQFSFDKNISTKLLWKQMEKAVTQIRNSNVWKQNNFLHSFKDMRCILFENDYLFNLINDVRKEPILKPSQILLYIDTYQQRLSESEKTLCAINQEFIEKQNTLSTNYFMKHRRLLWIYILCDEEKLAKVLSHVNEYLSNV